MMLSKKSALKFGALLFILGSLVTIDPVTPLLAQDSNRLSEIVSKNLDGKVGEYAFVVEDLEGKINYSFNEDKSFPSASVFKLFVLGAVMDEIKKGSLSPEDVIVASKSRLDSILGSNMYTYNTNSKTVSYTVDEAMRQIASVSDNYAAIMLAEQITWDKIQQFAQNLGTKNTKISTSGDDPITTTAADISLFLRKLHKGEIVDKSSSERLIDLLTTAQLNDRIPAKLPNVCNNNVIPVKDPGSINNNTDSQPQNTCLKIAHKTGEIPGTRNDAGIVFLKDNPYMIVMLSNNLSSEQEGVETLSNISKEVYDYFTKQD